MFRLSFRHFKLQSVLGLRFVAAATIPLLLFGWFAYQYLATQQMEEAEATLQRQSLNVRDEIDEFFSQIESDLLLIRSSVESLQAVAPAEIDQLLQTAANQATHFEVLYRLN
jgi:hypothetical protein